MAILRFYSSEEFDETHTARILKQLQQVSKDVVAVHVEKCYHVETTTPIEANSTEEELLLWLLKQPQSVGAIRLHRVSSLSKESATNKLLIEIGPRFNFSTPFSTNCVNICQNVGLRQVTRLETSVRYLISVAQQQASAELVTTFVDLLSDRMTECQYTAENLPHDSFNERLPQSLETWYYVPVLKEGRKALEEVNAKLGLAFGDWDLEYYTHLFRDVLQRDPTTVELFDCAQSNSEHSRHWFFRGKMIVDGQEQPKSLIRMIMDTQAHTNQNNTIKFSDNSSAIQGFKNVNIRPSRFDGPGPVTLQKIDSDLIFTAETHNMPTAVAPFSGATTGTGGRLRLV